MELRHLRTVVAIARHGSFTKAGEELHLAQSAVSQQLSRLEAELGLTLFTRSSRSVEITTEGALVVDYARRVLSEVEGMRDELDEMAGLLRGDLRLGGMWPTGLYDLSAVIADFHEQAPGGSRSTSSRERRRSSSRSCTQTSSMRSSRRSIPTSWATSTPRRSSPRRSSSARCPLGIPSPSSSRSRSSSWQDWSSSPTARTRRYAAAWSWRWAGTA
jgi:Bacterial regulatory helix-turn-helix protein, lysR family